MKFLSVVVTLALATFAAAAPTPENAAVANVANAERAAKAERSEKVKATINSRVGLSDVCYGC